ncbi:hypothetical protein PUNSTDRAFT_112220 [Punctularia strigosozonata HHB-11173 SS5]|uniref:uncharacterized protein n=1 Tax=Punctularia strigosozonata (strain HHB-11173) TaxID=741275 RepID=UPI00044172AD|nr:uncharacterized protein PUNSTDRAFT_112220 [Punctularia strigosozonata HHB-11173 SS5]EIN10360.1 hypothetical protein PUNSTDRAFT_112220 [Punctularia strigosozonata HHB-11173 SS5]
MTTLPSFCELMSSLGLENEVLAPAYEHRRPSSAQSMAASSPSSSVSSSPSQSHPKTPQMNLHPRESPSIIVSPVDAHPYSSTTRRGSVGTRYRYNPYSTSPSYGRRGSVASSTDDEPRPKSRSHSRSPELDAARVAMKVASSRKPPALRLDATYRRDNGFMADELLTGSTPISSLARRKSPQASPTSAVFPQRRGRTASPAPLMSVAIPTIPQLISPTSSTFAEASQHPAMAAGSPLPDTASHLASRRPHPTGVRLSAYSTLHRPEDSPHRRSASAAI